MRAALAAVAIVAVCASALHADVSTQEKTQVKFAGALGRVMNLFGGRATRDGVVTSVAVRGDRKATRTDQTLQIVDLKEEKVYEVNLKDKSYTITTFADLRRQLEEARRKAAEQSAKAGNQPAPSSGNNADKVEIDFNIKDSGQRKTVNGFDAHEVVMTVAVHEKGKKLEDAGGLVMTANTWLAPKMAGMKELADFDRRYAEKLASPTMLDAQQMATAMAMYPMMAEAMKKMQAENVNLDGTAVMTVMTVDAVGDPQREATAQEQPAAKDDSVPRSLGGLAGRLGRKIAKKDEPPPAAASTNPNRATFLTIQHDVLSFSATAADADLQVPAGFKLK